MGENSKIQWTDHTFNPWRGCTHATLADGTAHPGCEHCYAETMSKRNPQALGKWGRDGVRVVGAPAYWKLPLKWNAAAEKEVVRKRVFCASLADVFEDWPTLLNDHRGCILSSCRECGKIFAKGADPACECHPREHDICRLADVRLKLFRLIDATPWLDWLLLTKRPGNIRRMLMPWLRDRMGAGRESPDDAWKQGLPLNNVWLLTSVSDQATADALVPELLRCRHLVPVLGLSAEPLLGPINLQRTNVIWFDKTDGAPVEYIGNALNGHIPFNRSGHPDSSLVGAHLDLIIAGGESGGHARPMQPEWARSLRDQCQSAGTAFFFKQWGEWRPPEIGEDVYGAIPRLSKVGKSRAGRLLDGVEHNGMPEPARAH